ncbi:MAG: ATP-dependent helicase HrpA, partial [Saprospiraceae bacterium]
MSKKLTQTEIAVWREKITTSLSIDRHRLSQKLEKIIRHAADISPASDELKQFIKQLKYSCNQRSLRYSSIPTIEYPEDLPIAERRDEIKEAISN